MSLFSNKEFSSRWIFHLKKKQLMNCGLRDLVDKPREIMGHPTPERSGMAKIRVWNASRREAGLLRAYLLRVAM